MKRTDSPTYQEIMKSANRYRLPFGLEIIYWPMWRRLMPWDLRWVRAKSIKLKGD